jgi:hypothetical protein
VGSGKWDGCYITVICIWTKNFFSDIMLNEVCCGEDPVCEID